MSEAAERYRRAQGLVHELLELVDPDERARRLEAECAGDSALRAEVDWLLEALGTSLDNAAIGEVLDLGADAIARSTFADARLDVADAARYRLIERIGEGGMGQVWLAERTQGRVLQLVALKLLRGNGLGSEAALERIFEEGRILGALSHPNIARLIEAGRGADGAPFLAIEYVDGQPIDRACEARAMGLRARIELFIEVCGAVEYAHTNLVIHRDLKPGNILVDARGMPKLLDFGIARLLDAGGEGARAVTATRAMTLAYASPEQVEGRRLGTASDIYSLGVVLYELLTGQRPFDHFESDHARSNAIVSGDVTAPSEILRRTERDGRKQPMPRRIPIDLDAIVLKALRREPNQRYASVADLADDLRAFLASRPVSARRGQFGYRARRYTWRNRWLLAAAAIVIVLASVFTWRTVLAEREARRQAVLSDRVAEFLVTVFSASDSNVNMRLTHELTARDVLDAGAARIEVELADQPHIRARLYESIGNAYRHMNENVKGVALLRKAADIHLDPSVDQPLDAARCLEQMANAMANGQFPAKDAEAAARESLALAERLTAPGSQPVANAWMVLSLALNRSGNLVAAERAARTTLAMNERLPKGEGNRIDAAYGNLCIILTNRGLVSDAAPWCEQSRLRRLAEGTHVILAMATSRLSQLRAMQGEHAEAIELAGEAVAITRELKGESSPFGTVFLTRQAVILDDAGRHEEAAPLFERALLDAERFDGRDSGEHLAARLQLARHHARAGDPLRASHALRELVPEVVRRYGSGDPRTLVAKTTLAQAMLDGGQADPEARRLLDAAMAGWEATDDPGAPQPGYTRVALAQWFAMNGDAPAAAGLLDRLEAADSRADPVVRTAAAALRARLRG